MQADDHNTDDATDAQPTNRDDVDVDHLHELAHVERLLRKTDVQDVLVQVGGSGARISFTTNPFDEHYRGSKKAALANELAATSAWGLATIHDDFEDAEGGKTDSMLTVLYDPEDEDEEDAR